MKLYSKFLFAIFFVFNLAYSQTETISINWKDVNLVNDQEGRFIIHGFSQEFLSYNPASKELRYERSWKLSQNSYKITNLVYQPISKNKTQHIKPNQAKNNFRTSISYAGKTAFFNLSLPPIIEENGVLKKLMRFDLVKTSEFSSSRTSPKTVPSISNSVFATSNMYKFYVEDDGVHRISGAFLEQLGVDLDNLSSNSIHIYGHGGGMLPLRNSENQFFDPPKLAIQVVDGGDGVFNANDYVLFYATTTRQWNETSQTFVNAYADRAYYYIGINGTSPKRILSFTQPAEPPSLILTEFEEEQFYEVDEVSLALVGRRWFGDRFDIETQRDYNFEFDNLITSEPIELKVYAGAVSALTSSMNISANSNEVGTINFAANSQISTATGGNFFGNFNSNSDEVNISLTYNKQGNPSAAGFLDLISVKAKRALAGSSEQFKFYHPIVENQPGVVQYQFENASQINQIWDVSNFTDVTAIQNAQELSNFSFKANMGQVKTYVAVTSTYLTPRIEAGNVNPNAINLKGTIFNSVNGNFQDIDYLIITRSDFLSAAEKLANYRRNRDGLNVKVVQLSHIYEEFNSGKQDIGAIRNFVRYVYQNASSPDKRLKYLGFIGDTSVDYKNRLTGNTNVVPTYQSYGSFSDTSSSFMSDDFYTMMDPDEGLMLASEKMDIAVGRIVAETPSQANIQINKIIDHESRAALEPWRNNFILISDDVDEAFEFQDLQLQLDQLGDEISANKPSINVKKIHADAFQQQPSAGGDRYPEAVKAINDAIEVGAVVVNYFGHGGEDGLAQERLVSQTQAQNWTHPNRYNVFVTITCDFTKFDNPLRVTGGELTYWNNNGGAVALVTTTRSITVSAGVAFNNVFAPFLFDYDNLDETIAESVVRAKNNLSGNGKRIVFYIGDPAMKLPLPEPRVNITQINDQPIAQFSETLQALSQNKVTGQLVSPNGQIIDDYNGEVTLTLFDKRIERSTLGNDGVTENGELLIMDFTTLGEILFKGKASVTNGEFEFNFVLPKDTRIDEGEGRFSFYSVQNQALNEYSGFNTSISIGGLNENAAEDQEGPLINLYMNDENFVDGGITNTNPFILANLEDNNGINTAGGIGHDIVAILDGDEENPIILNEYYEAATDTYQSGQVYYQLKDLEPGPHTLSFKAWDVYNNSSTSTLNFMVSSNDELQLSNVLNYPNPFIDYTEFWFNHNRPFEPLEVQVQVFTVTGKVVWTHNQMVNTSGFLSKDITWNGLDDFGQKIGKGVYIYKLTVRSTITNQKQEKYEKLVILQ